MNTDDPTLHQPHPVSFTPGETLGRYAVEGVLGQGGMGTVLSVRDERLGRTVAAKVALGGVGSSQGRLIQKFVVEAQVTGQLEHPGIVPVHELAEAKEGGAYFFTMKQVVGENLGERIAREATAPLPLATKLEIFGKICDAIAFAHDKGVIHRDLEPANVMLGRFGEVLVVDWGLARQIDQLEIDGTSRVALDADAGDLHASSTDEETLDGQVVGTPAYMPPEQARGEHAVLDRRSDVYSLGAILYQLLCGAAPFAGKSHYEVLFNVIEGELVPPSRRARQRVIPWELEAVAMRALARAPADRYQNVTALRTDIARFLEGRTLAAVSYSPISRTWKWVQRHKVVVAAALLVVLVGVGGPLAVRWREDGRRRARYAAALDDARRQGRHVPPLAELRDSLAARRAAPPRTRLAQRDDAIRWRAPLAAALKRVAACERAAAVADGPAIARARRGAGEAVGLIALLAGDFTLAEQAFSELADHGAPAARVSELRAQVERNRRWLADWRSRRLGTLIADLRLGMASTKRTHADWRMEDYIFEAVGFRDRTTRDRLIAELDTLGALAKKRAEEKSALSSSERGLAIFACRVLGRIGLPGAAVPIGRFLRAIVRDSELAAAAGVALCNTRDPEAYAPLRWARVRMPRAAWDRVNGFAGRVPEPANVVDATLKTAEDYFTRGTARMETEDYEAALADFSEGCERYPDDYRLHNHRGIVLKRLRRYAEALVAFTRVVELGPERQAGHHNRGQALQFLGRFDEAHRANGLALERASSAKAKASVYGARADLEMARGRWGVAKTDLDRALALDPTKADMLMSRGVVHRRLGRLKAARADLDRAIAGDPTLATAWYERGCVRMKDDPRGALGDLDQAIGRQPRFAVAYRVRAMIAKQLGDLERAIADYDQNIRMTHKAESYVNRGIIYFERRQYARALKDFDAAIARDPEVWQGWVNRANALRQLDRRAEAIEAYVKARPRAPTAMQANIDRTLAALRQR